MKEKRTGIIIVGAGKGGTELIRLFRESESVRILGICDKDPRAQGISLARDSGIPVFEDPFSLLDNPDLDEIVNVTGSSRLQGELEDASPADVEVVGGHSAELMWRMVEERKALERELFSGRERYRALVEGANQPIVRLSEKGVILFINNFAAEVMGESADELVGRKVDEVFSPEAVHRFNSLLSISLKEKRVLNEIMSFEVRGENRVYDLLIQPMENLENVPGSVLVIAQDITARERSRRRIQSLNELLLELKSDPVRNIRMVTRVCGEVLGYTRVLYCASRNGENSVLAEWSAADSRVSSDKRIEQVCMRALEGAEGDKPVVVKDPASSVYGEKKSSILECGHRFFIGYPVYSMGQRVGILCAFSEKVPEDGKEDVQFTGILADILSREEERAAAIDALAERERDYRRLFDNAADLIAVLDRKGNFLDLNRRFEEESGYDRQEMLGRNFITSGIITKSSAALAMKYFLELLRNREAPIFEVDGVRKDGGIVNYEVRAVPFKEEGHVSGIQAILRNITDRKKDELRIKESQEYLNKIINSVADPIFVKDSEHRWVLLNDAFCRFMGHERQELLEKTDHDFFPQEEADVFWEKDDQVYRTGQENINEEKFTDSSGKTHTIITKKTLYVDSAGNKILVGIIRDITERKKAEEERQRQEELLKNIISTAPFYVFWKNTESVYLGCNQNFADMAGLDRPADILGKTDSKLGWTENEVSFAEQCDRDVLKTGQSLLYVEEPRHSPDGKEYTFLTSKVPLRNTEGRITGILGIHVDISERKNMEEVLRESESMYRTIFENTGSSMLLIEKDLTVSRMNAEFHKMSGYSRKDIEGSANVMDLIVEEERPKISEYSHLRQIDPNAAPRNYETRIRTRSGKVLDVYVTVAVIPETQRTVASLIDITALKQNEAELKRRQNMLNNMNKALEHKLNELETAMGHIKKLEGLVPICANCKKMRVEGSDPKNEDSWLPLEKYISDRSEASFTHGLCPDCVRKIYGDIKRKEQ
ncbi:MAG: PAS domain S-box protein [Candidatus Omnitrophica bacterium]|nr:PAS domain S-box protein [Candidatus Omnitrophota bacterium]